MKKYWNEFLAHKLPIQQGEMSSVIVVVKVFIWFVATWINQMENCWNGIKLNWTKSDPLGWNIAEYYPPVCLPCWGKIGSILTPNKVLLNIQTVIEWISNEIVSYQLDVSWNEKAKKSLETTKGNSI